VSRYHLLSDAAADADIEAAFEWYESEQPELGFEFLDEVRATYNRILDGPFKYQEDFHMEFISQLKMIIS
jgi:hypothetical protein